MYRYPIKQSELIKSEINLLSGKTYLNRNEADTLRFLNIELPVMNRHLYVKGGTLSKISDSLFKIKSTGDYTNKVTFYVAVSADMDEIKNSELFFSDSLVLPIK
jgi:hypothetical protein